MTSKRRTKKERRNSGRVTTKIYDPVEMPYEEVKWDDWVDHRDGMRDLGHDKTHIYKDGAIHHWDGDEEQKLKEINHNLKQKEKLREAKKTKRQDALD